MEVFKGQERIDVSSISGIFSLFIKLQHWNVTEKDRSDYVFRVQNVCNDIPGVGQLLSSFIPTLGIFATQNKKSANARGLARGGGGGGWAHLELTDAFIVVEMKQKSLACHRSRKRETSLDKFRLFP